MSQSEELQKSHRSHLLLSISFLLQKETQKQEYAIVPRPRVSVLPRLCFEAYNYNLRISHGEESL